MSKDTMEREKDDKNSREKIMVELVDNDLAKAANQFGISRQMAQDAFDCILLCRSMSKHLKDSFEEKKRQEKLDYDAGEKADEFLNAIHTIVLTREIFMKATSAVSEIMGELARQFEKDYGKEADDALSELEKDFSDTPQEI